MNDKEKNDHGALCVCGHFEHPHAFGVSGTACGLCECDGYAQMALTTGSRALGATSGGSATTAANTATSIDRTPCMSCDNDGWTRGECLAPEWSCECGPDARLMIFCPDCVHGKATRVVEWLRHYHANTPKHDFKADVETPNFCVTCGLRSDVHGVCELARP